MRKEAIGIAVNGHDVKIAHVIRDKHRLAVDYLESAVLAMELEKEAKKKNEEMFTGNVTQEEEDIFSIKGSYESRGAISKETGIRDNANVLYSLLRKFAARKIKVAFNVPTPSVTYQELDTDLDYDKNVFKGSLRNKIEQWKKGFNELDNVSIITRSDGTLCNVSCELKNPPIIDILEQLNNFFRGNLYLSIMDPNEVSLVNLARNSYNFRDYHEYTVIVEVEADFSRTIFMKGNDLLTISPIIPEQFSPNINDIIYSKIIYEQDNLNISEITNILLAGKASTPKTKEFFEQKFDGVRVGFIVSQPLADGLSTQFSREDLSEFAIPIGLAWKVVDAKDPHFIQTNLLPSQIINRQKVLKLNFGSYLLLVLLGLTAFTITWMIAVKKLAIGSLRRKNISLEERIRNSEETVKRVHQLEEQIVIMNKRMVLSDSLRQGSDLHLNFLENLNQSVLKTKSVWVEEVKNDNKNFTIKGIALKRNGVPEISEALGNAKIKKFMRADFGNQKIYNFEMEVNQRMVEIQSTLEPQTPPTIKANLQEPKIVSSEPKEPIASNQIASLSESRQSDHLTLSDQSNQQSRTTIAKLDNKQEDVTKNLSKPEQSMPNLSENQTIQKIENQEKFTDGSANFTIRISAHVAKFTAEKEVMFYRSKGFDANVTSFANSSREIPYWVCYGNFSTVTEAEQELQKLNDTIPGQYDIIETSKNNLGRPVLSSRLEMDSTHKTVPIKEANHTVSLSHTENEGKSLDYFNNQNNDKGDISKSNSSQHLTIKISAHAIKLTAEKEVEYYQSNGYSAYVTTFTNSSRDIPYWVCLGDYVTYTEAREKINELNQKIPKKYEIVPIN